MTKSMTATVIARAIEEGALTWDYTLGELLGEVIPAMHPGYRSVTLRHLLTHHAGLVNDLPPRPWPASAWPRPIRGMSAGPMPSRR